MENFKNGSGEKNVALSLERDNGYAVYVRNMCKRYDNGPPVLQNFSMGVKRGTIYGLLGSSGCGKTTVLSSLVGLREWDSGEVLVFGKKPGAKGSGIPGRRVGYTPQELALYDHLSIKETIQYYGQLYSMSRKEIIQSLLFLQDLLELPGHFKLVQDLSGGQKRRVSLALALCHSPQLLILDEPTVGLDPLLRVNIWNHLFKIVNNTGATIIITTHYIEEARQSNTIGVMRNGRLLVEDSPDNLLSNYKCELLEDVVVQLCRKDEAFLKILAKTPVTYPEIKREVDFKSSWCSNNNCIAAGIVVDKKEHESMGGTYRSSAEFDGDLLRKGLDGQEDCHGFLEKCRQTYNKVYGFTTVMMLFYLRYPSFLVLVLSLPTIQGILSIVCLGSGMREMHLGIVNHEDTNWTCASYKPSTNSCDLTALSCSYIHYLNQTDTLILDNYDSEDEALASVHLGNSWGYLTFPSNYTQHVLDRAASRLFAFDEDIEGSIIHAHIDLSQTIANYYLITTIYESLLTFIYDLAASCQIGKENMVLPIESRMPVYGTYDKEFISFVLPAIIIVSLCCLTIGLSALAFVSDFKKGTLYRARVAGLNTFDVIATHVVSQLLVTLGQIVIWSAILQFVFHFNIKGSILLVVTMCLLIGLTATGMGLMVGFIAQDEVMALVIAVFLFPIFLLYGGVIFPTESMPKFWQSVGKLVPISLPTHSLRSVMVRGAGWTHSLVWPGIAANVAWAAVAFTLAVIAYKRYCK